MKEITKEEKKSIEQKLKKIHLDIDNVPEEFYIKSKVQFRPLKDQDSSYKVYETIPAKDIDIYITNATRMDEYDKKYKNAKPITEYLKHDNDEDMENYSTFLNLVKKLDIDSLKSLEIEQNEFKDKLPFEIKYRENFIWDIYYSENDNKYFMMFPSEEEKVESLFYLIMKKAEGKKSKKNVDSIFVPISLKEPTYSILKKSECADLENYLWFFTGEWPNIYEIKDKDEKRTIQIIGQTPVYEKVKSKYKIVLNNKEEAQKFFKLIKALFILQSNMEQEYEFKVGIDDKGKLNFFYNHNQITYENLPEFIKSEIQRKSEKINNQIKQNIEEKEKHELLKEVIANKNVEYLNKEKQIVTFLECKKTFFGRISYFFKKKKKTNKDEEKINKKENIEESNKVEEYTFEKKDLYTIEDLLKVGEYLEQKEQEFKNLQMDIKALEVKRQNLESKIKNATQYINEIESHKKSIFDFWKFTNKDEVTLLNEAEQIKEETTHKKIKSVFSFEDDIEDFSQKVDSIQRNVFNDTETNAVFAIYNDVKSFSLLRKAKLLKKDENEIQKILKGLKEQYNEDYEKVKEKDFDIFGSVVEDKTKIKVLKNNKHREIEKDKYQVLNINLDTEIDDYKDIIKNYNKIIEDAIYKMASPMELSIYKVGNDVIENSKWEVMELNPNNEIKKIKSDDDNIVLTKINIKENMPLIFYSNIMFYDNKNKTLPLGMDLSTEVLVDIEKYDMKLVSRKDFKLNVLDNEFDSYIKNVQVYEYDVELKEKK